MALNCWHLFLFKSSKHIVHQSGSEVVDMDVVDESNKMSCSFFSIVVWNIMESESDINKVQKQKSVCIHHNNYSKIFFE